MTPPALALIAALVFAQAGDAPPRADAMTERVQDEAASAPFDAPLSSEPGSLAILRGLDKVTARTRDFEAPVGDPVTFGALELTVQYCRKRPPEEPPEVYAFLEVYDRRTDGFGEEVDGERIFSGWMFASSPALNALEHPVYDVWVIDCRI